ncbi:hypothetical protein SDC9_157965 [bioreactor metagenome]|uniref:Uncharacterized protein n=1 Tax=bioreactor metagenome TaxID=1076179 RepID=A0A645F9U0_9ZZZZ
MIGEAIAERLRKSSIDYPMPENPLFSEFPKIIKELENANKNNEELKAQNIVLQEKVEKLQNKPKDKIIEFISELVLVIIGFLLGHFVK